MNREKPGAALPWPTIQQLLAVDERFITDTSCYLLAPKTITKLAALLYWLKEEKVSYSLAGRGKTIPFPQVGVCVSTRALCGVQEIQPQVIAVEAGCDIHTLQSWLFERGYALNCEDEIGTPSKGSVGSLFVRGSQTGFYLNQLSLKQRVLGLELVEPDGARIQIGYPLEAACVGPALHQGLWGVQQIQSIVATLYFKVAPMPAKRLYLSWSYRDRAAWQAQLEALNAFTTRWERLDWILPNQVEEQAFILAQIAGDIENMQAFESCCPGIASAIREDKRSLLKAFLHTHQANVYPIIDTLLNYEIKKAGYIWYHELAHYGWKFLCNHK